ncbi:tetratricopeptide repeat protein [Pseudomonas sp. 21LCFQ02]|uniref:tetratricopeptide repeat protein n=1 Tax=Pseudomonas sp. 21LCFQ02 TaxID=2957505 RepID=UPI00209AA426|nr:tetratricopeptide repeat protein [Pseudomonas sp. 21LCFQ02]MCO8168671.1 tetratricopeptide repeat protein [Pseudomonas sp. 21LCFQ02]
MPNDSPQPTRRGRQALIIGSLVGVLVLALWAWRSETSRPAAPVRPSQSYSQTLELARDGKPGAARLLYQQLARDDLADERRIALLAELPNYPSPQALKLLKAQLDHESPAVSLAAVESAVRLLPGHHLAVVLGPLLNADEPALRLNATLALTRLSPDELGLYFAALQHSAEAFQHDLAQQPPSVQNRMQLGRLYRQTGDNALALNALQEAVKLAPDNLLAALARIEQLDDNQQADQARQLMRQLLEKHPDSALLQHALGIWLRDHGQAEFALLSLARAAELAADNNDYRYDLAVTLHTLEQLEPAQKQLQQILQNQPANRRARVLLIQYARESGQLQNVQVLLAQLEQQNPDDPALQQGL